MWFIRIIKDYLERRKWQKKKEETLIKEVAELLSDKRENCIVCGCDTGYSRITNIKDRKYYVRGSGQLCKECWQEIYEGSSKLRRQVIWEME